MTPLEAAQAEILDDPTSIQAAALKILLAQTVGCENAKSLDHIVTCLNLLTRRSMTVKHFQQTVLQQSRRSDWFICSCNRGIYLPKTREDLEAMVSFYRQRIDAEQQNLDNCLRVLQKI